ncbi:MAG: translation initiation factor IF-2 [Deltaproteobacteria bacterium]|nr:translation initiation factor IF-2 [Deltaproteobacteria bacterium]
MPRKRIHELAKEWGMDTRYLLAKLEELGIHSKKAQSTLTDEEIAVVRPGAAPATADTSALVLGEEKVVGERMVTEMDEQSAHVVTAREEIRESRVRPNVIRRRTTRVEVASTEEAPLPTEAPQEFTALMPEDPFAAPAPLPLAFDLPGDDIAPAIPEVAIPEFPTASMTPETSSPTPSHATPSETPVMVEAPRVETPRVETPRVETSPVQVPQAEALQVKAQHVEAPRVQTPRVEVPRVEAKAPVTVPSAPPPSASRPAVGVAPSATLASAKPAPGVPLPGERSSRVLGRIDLGSLAPEPRPRTEFRPASRTPAPTTPGSRGPTPSRAPTPSREQPPAAAPAAPTDATGKRPKKRKVVHSPETTEVQERDLRLVRGGNRKKRVLPGKDQRQTEITVPKASKRVVRISEVVTVGDLARNMGVKAGEVIKKLMGLGVMATINQALDIETATLVAAEFEHTIENVAFDVESALEVGHEEHADEEKLEPRPPVVTIMGHVDHGKTSLLDMIRKTNVTEQEHGGITQHIGAYSVPVAGRSVTFLDTPGHEAFTSMRARGAQVTDLVILVVAADDGVMPQTVEALNHARAAKVPMIVAINKIDKPGADQERVKRELLTHSVVSEELGGDTIFAPVSAKTGDGIPNLLEMILLQADIMELRAHPEKLARGTIVEAKLDRGRGPVATVLVQEGSLKVGDPFVCGSEYGRIRAMVDSYGNKIERATPSIPVEILGLNGVPEAGDRFTVLADEASAREVAEHRRVKRRETELAKSSSRSTLEEFYQQVQAGEVKELKAIVKADVQGSVEAVSDALSRLSSSEVKMTILHSSVGGISESDVLLASASQGIIIGFNVKPESKAVHLAERENVEIRLYTIIYEAIEDVRAALEGMLAPTFREKPLGKADVRQAFPVSRLGLAAGCLVAEGKLTRGSDVRLIRDQKVVYTGRIASLRRFKDDVKEVTSGMECGVLLENFQDPKAGDTIEAFEMEQVLRRLEPRAQQAAR